MGTVWTWVIAGGVMVVMVALAYVYFRFVKASSTANGAVGLAGKVMEGIAGMLPDDTSKLDAHDVVLVVGHLASALPKWAADPSNVQFTDVREEVLKFLDEQRAVVPQLSKLPQDVLEQVASALFSLAKALQGLKTS